MDRPRVRIMENIRSRENFLGSMGYKKLSIFNYQFSIKLIRKLRVDNWKCLLLLYHKRKKIQKP